MLGICSNLLLKLRSSFPNLLSSSPSMDPMPDKVESLEESSVSGTTMDDDTGSSSGDNIDRISDLPDTVLCHILSFLPTKHAVATSILSTKWKHLFPLIPNPRIILDDTLLLHPGTVSENNIVSFRNFGDRLLNVTLADASSIQLLRLTCQKFDDGICATDWVRAARRLNVQRIDLHFHQQITNPEPLLGSLYGCNIQTLSLVFDTFVNLPLTNFSLPSLKMLVVRHTSFKIVNLLVEGCPAIHFLGVHYCDGDPGDVLCIRSPTLRLLVLRDVVLYPETLGLIVDAPRLEQINYLGYMPRNCLLRTMKFIHIASLELYQNGFPESYEFEFDEQAANWIKACFDVEKLGCSGRFIEMFEYYPHPLPRLPKLSILGIKNISSFGWKVLPKVLEYTPNLKKLVIKNGFDQESYRCFKSLLPESKSICLTRWRENTFVLEISRNRTD